MKTHLFIRSGLGLAVCAALGCAACEQTDPTKTSAGTTQTNNGSSSYPSQTPAPGASRVSAPSTNAQPTTVPGADNTERNKADRGTDAKTPMDQGQSSPDIKITADIRKAILSDKGMSVNAQNCKIITDKGMVTLRGAVNTQAEKDAIEALAKNIAGNDRVTNQLEVKAN